MDDQEKLQLALIQFDALWEQPYENLQLLSTLLSELPDNTDLIILPEAFATGFSMNALKVSEPMNGPIIEWMKATAQQKSCCICGGVFIEEDGKYYNRFVWVSPDLQIHTYDKRHLFSLEGENNAYSPGNSHQIIYYKGWTIFPQICYDLRFPVWSRNVHHYDLLINIANWPAARSKVWKTLLKARAIENQCFVAASNRIGTDGQDIAYSGKSMVINFKGETIINAKNKHGIFVEKIDRGDLDAFRRKFNSLRDADQFDIYL